MRREFIIILVLVWGVGAQATIVDVTIEPEEPTEIDSITIFVSGEEPYSISIVDSIFTADETSLTLDIFLDSGLLPVVTPWSHYEEIGLLSAGIYDLTVNTLNYKEPDFNDTYFTSFEVVPEPATVLLFGLGGIGLKRSLA